MKKFGSFALAALLVAALSVSASAASKSEAAKGTATIDGKKDNVYACEPLAVEIDETTGKKTEKGATATAHCCIDCTKVVELLFDGSQLWVCTKDTIFEIVDQ